jgi:hypothetical protein
MDRENDNTDFRSLAVIFSAYAMLACSAGSSSHSGKPGSDASADASADALSDAPDFNMPPYCVESDARAFPSCQGGTIFASNYANTCQSDSDCVLVETGEFCEPCQNTCGPSAAINNNAYEQFQLDVNKTPGGSMGAVSCAPCCGVPNYMACCQLGHCRVQLQCTTSGPSNEAGAD